MMKLGAQAVLAVLAPIAAFSHGQAVGPLQLDLTALEDSGAYFVYRYEAHNPSGSTAGVSGLELDISASSGTPTTFSSTGALFDLTGMSGSPIEPQAEVGPITPAGWEAALDGRATLSWYPPGGTGAGSADSIAPGDTLPGLGIRSSYLPGISTVVAEPTVQSCCLVPDTIDGELIYPKRGAFAVRSAVVVPRYMPAELDIALVRGQLDAVCDDPLWIDDPSLCAEIADSLAVAESRYGVDNYLGARQALQGAAHRLDVEREPSGEVQDNAFFLLDTNIQYLLNEVIPSQGRAEVFVCAGGPSAEMVSFSPSNLQGTPSCL